MGGSQYQAKCIIDELLGMDRYEIYYVTRRADPTYQPQEYRVIPVSKSTKKSRMGYSVDSFRLLRLLRQLRPDVIYQRVACAYTGIAAYYAKHAGCNMVWHIAHDNDLSVQGASFSGPVVKRIENAMIRYGIRNATRIIAQTAHQAELLVTHYGRNAVAVVPNLHPLPSETIDKSGCVTVVWVANFKTWKQPEVFVRLAAELGGIGGVRFVMVGAPHTGKSPRLDPLLAQINATPALEYVGPKSQEEVNEILAKAHIFVNTSRYEGFANTFIQAWMRRVPVVSLHVNPDNVFGTQQVGIHAGDYEGLKSAVMRLILDAPQREALGAAARAYALNHHSPRNVWRIVEAFEGGATTSRSA